MTAWYACDVLQRSLLGNSQCNVTGSIRSRRTSESLFAFPVAKLICGSFWASEACMAWGRPVIFRPRDLQDDTIA